VLYEIRKYKPAEERFEKKVIQKSAVMGAGIMMAGSAPLFSQNNAGTFRLQNIASKGYAARNESGNLSLWSFERRALKDDDVLVDIRFSGVCHSDIHQIRGDWGEQQYPQVPGHEISGIVAAVGEGVTKFKVGDRIGVGTMVGCTDNCDGCTPGEEQYCEHILYTYGFEDPASPTGITQGGYSNNIVVQEHFGIRIPETISLEHAASLLCAGITTYMPLVQHTIQKGDKVGVAGIGVLGHLAVKFAVARGAEVYGLTTTPDKAKDILAFGAKEAIVVDNVEKLQPYKGMLDYMISTIPVQYNVAAYASVVKPGGFYTQVGMPEGFEVTLNNFELSKTRVNYNSSLTGGIPQTQELINYCAENNIVPQTEIIRADQVNEAWTKVLNKEARYRYVIDTKTI
jgi:uncharacterized zinc-type alcohol dehydrogenase-like protein